MVETIVKISTDAVVSQAEVEGSMTCGAVVDEEGNFKEEECEVKPLKKSSFEASFKLQNSSKGFHNNSSSSSYNDRQGFNDRDSGRGRGSSRNWREDEGERRNFQPRGNFERKSSRWMDNQKTDDDWEGDDQQQQQAPEKSQQDSSEVQEQSSRNDESFDNNGNGENENDRDEVQQEMPPGTEENQQKSFEEPEATPFESNEPSFDNHHQGDSVDAGGNEDNPGNTTPLCDEAESKD